MYKKTTLSNGLRIITVPMKNTKAVTVLVMVGTGSKYETKENNGLSHFLEHIFFKGTKKNPTTLKVVEPLDKVGGIYNAFTDKECTGYWAKVDSKYLDLALDWVSDIFLNSNMEEKEINKEKGVIIEEMNLYLDTPTAYISDLWEELLYGNQPAGWLIIGNKKNIIKFKRKDFLDYLNNHYSSKNTIVCIAGDIEPKLVEEKIRNFFKKIKSNIPKPKLKVIEKQENPNSLIHFKKTDQTHLFLGVRGRDIFHPQKFSQEILATILGGFMSSRLFISIRERRGLAYYVRTISGCSTDTGYLVTSAGVDHRNAEKAIGLILKEYKILKNKKISQSELQKAKDNLRGTLNLSLESSDSQASFYAGQELLEHKILTPEEQLAKIDAITVEDIQKLAKDIFRPEKLNLALIGPFKNKERFNKLLKI
jgi:predicted Zn-dependent peptidase